MSVVVRKVEVVVAVEGRVAVVVVVVKVMVVVVVGGGWEKLVPAGKINKS